MMYMVQALLLCWLPTALAVSVASGDWDRYIIASFPSLQAVNYIRLPDSKWRPLVVSNLLTPASVCIDTQNMRLFVSDTSASAIYWYQLQVTGDHTLQTDGVQRLAMMNVIARGITVDSVGSLYIVGETVVNPPLSSEEVVLKEDVSSFTSGNISIKKLWSKSTDATLWLPKVDDAGQPIMNQPMTPMTDQINIASAIGVDPFYVFWGNGFKTNGAGGPASILRAAIHAPMPLPTSEPELRPKVVPRRLADNVDSVTGLVLTPAGVYYTARTDEHGGIYGMTREQIFMPGASCLSTAAENTTGRCQLVAAISLPTGITYDGDSTVFVADKGQGAVWSFGAGVVAAHVLEKAADAKGIMGIAALSLFSSAYKAMPGLLAVAMVAFLSS